ncbi:TonB-dependent siderophore receptor [Pseudochelatococcus lubricantis]|uniref:TonB-dependent siderophore receptor n=1 Tax=Pseudochelatococcus lubricantis TaxID=1538102 RepID=UPI0035E4C1CC
MAARPGSSFTLLYTTALFTIGLSWSALGQEAASGTTLDPVVIEATAGSESATGPVNGYVARRTATGAKISTPIEAIPQSVSVIGRQQLDDQGAQKVDEALRYTPGVFTQPFGPDSDTNWMFIRGFQATQSGTYLDGLPLFSYAFAGFYIDTFNRERIEVLRGPASVLYGGSNPGGIVNYISKRPTGERKRYFEAGINDAGTAYLGVDIGDRLTDKFDYRFSGIFIGGDGYTDFADELRGSFSPSFTWRPTGDTTLTVLGNYTFFDQNHGGGAFLPYIGTVRPAPFGRIRRDANFTEPDIDFYERQQVSVGYELEHALNDRWAVRQNFRFGYADIEESSLYAYGYQGFSAVPAGPDFLLERINFGHKTDLTTVTVDNQIEGDINTGPINHRLLFGLDYKYVDMNQIQATGAATPISAVFPVYGALQGLRSAYIDQNIKQNQVGLYVQDQLRFGDGWIVTLNGRYDYVDTKAKGTPEFKGTDAKFSGRAGLAYEFDNGITPYASVATFFLPSVGSSLATNMFKPESGHQYEVGVKYRPTFVDGLFTVSFFDLTRQNVITGPYLAETQIGEVNSQGVELEAKVNITDNLRVLASFTAFNLEITDDADTSLIGNTPFIVPEQQAALGVDYTFDSGMLKGLVLGGGVRYVGSSWVDNANTLKVPSATVFDARIGYKRDNWGVDLNITNLFDKKYVASCQTQFSCGYAEGRVFKFKAHIDL